MDENGQVTVTGYAKSEIRTWSRRGSVSEPEGHNRRPSSPALGASFQSTFLDAAPNSIYPLVAFRRASL